MRQLREATMLSREYLETYKVYYGEYLRASEAKKTMLYERLSDINAAWKALLAHCEQLREQYFASAAES